MLKRIVICFVIVLLLFVSACTPETFVPTQTPIPTDPPVNETTEPTVIATAEANPESVESEEVIVTGEKMPCSTVYDYELSPEAEVYQDVADQLPEVTEEDWVRGDPSAPITIIEYADFQCPACGNFALYLKVLMESFPGIIRTVFRHMPLESLHDKGFLSSMAAEAAGAQGKFWEMHDLLYEYQAEWSGYTEQEFIDWAVAKAEALGLDIDQFEKDLTDTVTREALEQDANERLEMGLHYTPFVIINGRIFRDNKPDLFSLIGIHAYDGYQDCPLWVIDPEKSYTATLETSAGEIVIDLFPDVAPIAVNSFVFLAQNGWYDDVYFHRVLDGFVAQAGDPSGFGVIGPGYTFVNETDENLSFDRAGILGMANAGVDTNGSQFFITLAPTTDLDGNYTIFGEVIDESLSVLDEIARRDPRATESFEDATIIYSIEITER